jgi:integrase
MKYIYKDGTYYFFKRKIPYTNKNYSFSLRTKNLKIAKLIVGLFLKEAESLFYILKSMSKEDILNTFEQIDTLLKEYKKRALIEYSELEKSRQEALKHSFYSEEHGKTITRDASHPVVIEYWQNHFQDAISGSSQQVKALFKKILKRTDLPRDFYKSLSDFDKSVFELKLLKAEKEILQYDYERTLHGKDKLTANQGFNISPTDLYNTFEVEKNKALKHKTFQELKNEYIKIRIEEVKNERDVASDKLVINILESVSDKPYLIDYDEDDYTNALDIILNLSPNNGKTRKIYEQYKNDYKTLTDFFKKENYPKQGERTGWNKFSRLRSFLEYAIEIDLLQKNYYKKRIFTYDKITKDMVPFKIRLDFNTSELNRLFSSSSWYSQKEIAKTLQQHPERFYIPLIALFTGMRLNEIASLSKKDIAFEEVNKIYYFDLIEIDVKNKSSKRIVPIHKFLLNNLKFKKYFESIKKEDRLFPKLSWHEDNGYGHNISKAFNQKTFKSQWINEDRLNHKVYMLDFHSFRHTSITRLADGGLEAPRINRISGHTQETQSQKSYTHSKIKEIHKDIHKILIDDIDFSHLEKSVNQFYT